MLGRKSRCIYVYVYPKLLIYIATNIYKSKKSHTKYGML